NEKFGGNIGYSHTIGERQKRESNAAFSPDMFAAVSREYSQRIATVATVPPFSVSLRIMPQMTVTNVIVAMAAVTTTTTTEIMAAMTTRMTMTMHTVTRVANVQATMRIQSIVGSTYNRFLITLPATISGPYSFSRATNFHHPSGGADWRIIATGEDMNFPNFFTRAFLTLVQGSEEFIGQPITATVTTGTTTMTVAAVSTTTRMTAAAVSTTTRITTFATTFITLTANSAMGGNNEKNTPPNFPQKRADILALTHSPRTFSPTG
ncbi:MAG: hypothetical protein ACR2P4_08650, partial [Gammaproteobacteria bacterium]